MENGLDDIPLFDPELLKAINWDDRKASFRNGVTCLNPGENLILRPLSTGDYEKGVMDILGQLTTVGEVNKKVYLERFYGMKSCPNTYHIVVIEDETNCSIVAAASLIVEQKLIHSAATRGRVEDVVVSSEYRGKQLGKLLVETVTLLGKTLGCYKMSLECKEENFKFYEPHGFEKDGQIFLVQRYKD